MIHATYCETSSCSPIYSDRKCKCYPNASELKFEPDDTPEQKHKAIHANQICAFEAEDGFMYPCDPGCCQGGCPGQCEEVAPRPPRAVYTKTGPGRQGVRKMKPVIQLWAIVTVCFLLLAIILPYTGNGLKG